jgi:hypothetical protein
MQYIVILKNLCINQQTFSRLVDVSLKLVKSSRNILSHPKLQSFELYLFDCCKQSLKLLLPPPPSNFRSGVKERFQIFGSQSTKNSKNSKHYFYKKHNIKKFNTDNNHSTKIPSQQSLKWLALLAVVSGL